MVKILAFDVSETLQTCAQNNDEGRGQAMVDSEGVIPNAYSVLIGGKATADLLIEAQAKGIKLYLVTNNGDGLDAEVINRTLQFLANYGVIIDKANYLGPKKGEGGSKVPRLQEILKKENINKAELVFFDDASENITQAQGAEFKAIRVKNAQDLQEGIRKAVKSAERLQKDSPKSEEKSTKAVLPSADLGETTEIQQRPAIFEQLDKKISDIIADFRKRGESIFSIGMKNKAHLIEQALIRAKEQFANSNEKDLDAILNFQKDGQPSLREELNIQRLFIHKAQSTSLKSVLEFKSQLQQTEQEPTSSKSKTM